MVENPDEPESQEIMEVWGRKMPVLIGAIAVLTGLAASIGVLISDPEFLAGPPAMICLALTIPAGVLIVYARYVFSVPVARYDPAEKKLITTRMFGAERSWPRDADGGRLVAARGRIKYLHRNGREQTLINRTEVNSSQFDFVHHAIKLDLDSASLSELRPGQWPGI
ncbi:hypothetical protein [Glycomyces tritici]|uniref:PH domain-containing protein n=1 Tax=Glycomyces tritici TaxID=2665176 RepID=A0ABT7YMN5_9ACTN|nr:hypothetical protein [Glycomyces tritici]MDN3239905.1 hypothetical protein [Glycomyces tritici]